MKLWGVVGRETSGKGELIDRLVTEFTGRGLRVSALKRAPDSFDVDRQGKDSHRHRLAGASEVLLSSRNRWTLMHELNGEETPGLDELLTHLAPVDLVLFESDGRDGHPRIEAHRTASDAPLRALDDPNICAIASDGDTGITDRPAFHLDDTDTIADFIARELDL